MIKKAFNLVEVTLALAVVGIGMAGVMALFPVALNASRDALGNNYASQIADQFMAMAAMSANSTSKSVGGISYIDFESGFLGNLTDPYNSLANTSSTTPSAGMSGQVYLVSQGTGTIKDCNAIVKVWKTQIAGVYIAGFNLGLIPYKYAACFHIEVSWPAELPFAQRQIRYYSMELYNQNPPP